MITACLTYFRSLSLLNLEAALFSLRMQDLSQVEQIVVLDNDSPDSSDSIREVITAQGFPVPVVFQSVKHGDASRAHSWSTNTAVRLARTPWVFFTRADYILDYDLLRRSAECMGPDCFVVGDGYHLHQDVASCERTSWRHKGPTALQQISGSRVGYTVIDSGVWMSSVEAFHRVGGLDEGLTAWGHAQTHFQYKLHKAGTVFVRIPEVMFYHPIHGAQRDLTLANQQLSARGLNVKELWARYEGEHAYR